MKIFYLALVTNLLSGICLCKAYQSPAFFLANINTNSSFYYTSSGSINIDKMVEEELESLSATFLVKPHIYFYKTDKDSLLMEYQVNPQLHDYNVFVDLNIFSAPPSEMKNHLIVSLTNQFAKIIAKKYKLGLAPEQESLFSYYILGYFLNKNNGDGARDTSTDEVLKLMLASTDNITTDNPVNESDRNSCIKQGYDDSIFASKKRIYVTLKQVINRGLDFVSNQDQ